MPTIFLDCPNVHLNVFVTCYNRNDSLVKHTQTHTLSLSVSTSIFLTAYLSIIFYMFYLFVREFIEYENICGMATSDHIHGSIL